ncbi:MAG: hypothetical protein MR936_07800, partial [Eubacterium sp.]|nr:hypothetical protein [Eubacterium sp.]
ILLTLTIQQGTVFQWTLFLAFSFVGPGTDVVPDATPSFSGYFPEPCLTYFMISDTGIRQLYDENYESIVTLYEDIAADQTYEKAWSAYAKSPVRWKRNS